ncbi:MAG: lamin tail domain-containing protein, partial [Bacteroidales bacterium]|nr:lamin tail domain-containing protein [Bacteroidales bacterium]
DGYQRIQGNNPDGTRNPVYKPMIDVLSLADYMILNFYGGNWDWDHHNWVAIRNRISPGKGFRFFAWDSEHMVEGVNSNILSENNDKCPSRIFQQLRQNPEFKRLFADRVQKYCFNNGALTPFSAAGRWILRAGQIDKAVLAESARWGDYRRDVHRWQTAGPFELYTKESHWQPQMNYMLNTYFPNRTNNFISHLRSAGLFPMTDAPVFLINNNPAFQQTIERGSIMTMTSEKGIIYYTTDGSDPVIWESTPVIAPAALQYAGPLMINESSHLKARAVLNNEWSATSEQFFIIPENYHDLKITEIHYHPADDGITENREFEFIEIKNTGTSTLDLGGVRFTEGVEYEFTPETSLGPKKFIVLASNYSCFYDRYGFFPFDEYNGQLDNNGEMLVLVSAGNDTLCSISYEDSSGWPEAPDGSGKSLVPVEINPTHHQDCPECWRESYVKNGSPGKDDIYVLVTAETSKLVTVLQNYPNPFSDFTRIIYTLHEDARVRLLIYNITGKHIVTIEDLNKPAGQYNIVWSGTNQNNSPVDDGMYFYRIMAEGRNGSRSIITKKLLIIR